MEAAMIAAVASESGVMPVIKPADPTGMTEAELEMAAEMEIENSEELEMKGIKLSVEYMEQHWSKLIAARTADEIVLSASAEQDAALRRCFRQNFPTMDIRELSLDALKHQKSREQWRTVLNQWDGKLDEYNMICLLRADCTIGYDNDNTWLVPRAQFLMIEAARNAEGTNDLQGLRDIAVVASVRAHKDRLHDALLTDQPVPTLLKYLEEVATVHPLLSKQVLRDTLLARFVARRFGSHFDRAIASRCVVQTSISGHQLLSAPR